jgi:hypothetical protein
LLSAAIAVATAGNGTERIAPEGVTTVTEDRLARGLNTANDAVAGSKTAAWASAPNGCTTPSGAPAGGDTAACAGATVGGGESGDFAEHPPNTGIASITAARRIS